MIGTITGLLPLYDQLVCIFKDNIATSGGNNDSICTSLVELPYLSYEFANNEDPAEDFIVDVMEFLFNEIYDDVMARSTISYAPYIMLLIKHMLQDQDLSDDCE
jgi:hypothetical protein